MMSLSRLTTSTLQLGELRVHLLEAGSPGLPEVLLIPGGMGDAESHWHKTLVALGTSFHVYAPDLPGFHNESDALKKVSLPQMMQWINELLRTLNIEKVALVGTSIGALLARFYAARSPAVVERLVLVGGGGITKLPGIARMLLNAPGISQVFYRDRYRRIYSREALSRSIYQQDVLTEEFFQRLKRASEGFMPLLRAILSDPLPPVQTPTCPTLIIWGKEDRLAPLSEGRQLLREIPSAELVLIEQAGHMPMLEQPDLFIAAIKPFLDR
ncbi:MAG TPA: alpha/beta hydrolase [Ktedonobacteraceae bacterium]|nr:alpha/beta hydrolase [Ktedonobacteraceae bacterium]